MKLIIIFLSLLFPAAIEVALDRDGDHHPNNDWKLRGMLCMIVGLTLCIIYSEHQFDLFTIDFLRYTLMSGLVFTAVFPYWINWVHLKRKITVYTYKKAFIPYALLTKKEVIHHVMNHLSDTAWPDKIWIWRLIGPYGRLIFNILLLGLTIFIYTL